MKSFLLPKTLLALAGCSLLSLPTMAQDENAESGSSSTVENRQMTIVAASDDETGGPPMIISTMSSSADGQPAVFSFSGPGGDIMNFGGAAGPMDPMGLMHNPDVQKEIELDENQLADFKKMNADFQKQMQKHTSGFRDGNIEPGKLKEMAAAMKQLKEEQAARMKELLVPHQMDRLQQISTQQYMEAAGTANALVSKHLADQLGLTEEQVERLKKRSEEVNNELKEKMAQLKEEAREKILAELTPEQKEKISQLTGKKYTYKMPEFKGFGKRGPVRPAPKTDSDED